ncbi:MULTISPECIES: hypothetical protein [Clostridium]|uniref:hypothetical protein n=1 Tax=Clostridium TaxID=1485 RepID=UPI000825EE2A|nr:MULTISPECIES: hypothetical protein [Clostridium]PJI08674.1 hypothetical protein CUB90_12720 [Clostridium sp. CT7]
MTWKLEIYRALFLALGTFEIIANANFLCLENGMEYARLQHGEIPKRATRKQLKVKVVFMLIFGLIFFSMGINSYFLHYVNETYFLIVLILFAVYAFGEALYYRYWKTFGFSAVSALLLLVFWIWR